MAPQSEKKLKMLCVFAPCILIVGLLGIIFNISVTPEEFPTISLFLAAIGAILAVVIPQT